MTDVRPIFDPVMPFPPRGQPGVAVVPAAAVHVDIHAQVLQSLKDVPVGRTVALVSVETAAGFNLAVAHKAAGLGGEWTVEAYIGKAGWSQPLVGGAQVMFSR